MGIFKNMWIEQLEKNRLKQIEKHRRNVFIDQAVSPDPLVQCESCFWVGRESQLISHMLSPGSDLEPPDYQSTCPQCNRELIRTLDNDEICEGCIDDIKYNDGDEIHDHCHDCLISAAEYLAEPDR
jgi:hypothetical protein